MMIDRGIIQCNVTDLEVVEWEPFRITSGANRKSRWRSPYKLTMLVSENGKGAMEIYSEGKGLVRDFIHCLDPNIILTLKDIEIMAKSFDFNIEMSMVERLNELIQDSRIEKVAIGIGVGGEENRVSYFRTLVRGVGNEFEWISSLVPDDFTMTFSSSEYRGAKTNQTVECVTIQYDDNPECFIKVLRVGPMTANVYVRCNGYRPVPHQSISISKPGYVHQMKKHLMKGINFVELFHDKYLPSHVTTPTLKRRDGKAYIRTNEVDKLEHILFVRHSQNLTQKIGEEE